jgi:hypothetical protein
MNFCFKTAMRNYFFDTTTRKKIWNENVQRKFCQESSNLPFAVPGNVKLKLPIHVYGKRETANEVCDFTTLL